jgi:hypothetical protein
MGFNESWGGGIAEAELETKYYENYISVFQLIALN